MCVSLEQSFGFGDVIEVCGLAVAVPEGVVVEVKQPQGGWVFQKHGDRTLLEEVEALKVKYYGGKLLVIIGRQ